ncbi:MAG: M20/M25/M40 family metallo-hydrolase [Oscillospiraceae bacterium]|jgi:carboxypeptidase PM20D1|nr:M20/M25/M40 family metallo-hydrolase [Oscillospiraceae bacterium]
MWWLLLIIPAVIVLFLLIIIIRAAMFTPKSHDKSADSETGSNIDSKTAENDKAADVDLERAITHLQEMLKIETVWNWDNDPEGKNFKAFRELLPQLYPLIHEHCTYEQIGRSGIFYHWRGKSADNPTVYMAHYDVVPADEDKWQKPPYSAIREDGEIWGRGTLDTKGTLCAALEAAETLLAQGFIPENDIYFTFGGDEETDSTDIPAIIEILKLRGVRPAFVLDEGGAVVENIFPGVKRPTALIGTAEKGMVNVSFSVSGIGGHASAPPVRSPVGVLARAVTNVEDNPLPAFLCEPVLKMFDTLGRHSTFAYRLIFANLWCFKGLFTFICKKSGGELNALVRTTCAFTQMKGSSAHNVLPPSASVSANMRLMNPDNIDSVLVDLEKRVNDNNVKITRLNGVNPSAFSNMDSEGYTRLSSAIGATWPEAIISPYLMIAASDSRHYCEICDVVLRFSAMALSSDDRKRIHGNDERISESQFLEALMFYQRIISAS